MENANIKIIAEAAFDHAAKKLELKERSEQNLYFAHGNGLFKASPELISFVSLDWDDFMIIQDSYGNPVRIDRKMFILEAKQCYQTIMNDWHTDYQKLLKTRNAKNI